MIAKRAAHPNLVRQARAPSLLQNTGVRWSSGLTSGSLDLELFPMATTIFAAGTRAMLVDGS